MFILGDEKCIPDIEDLLIYNLSTLIEGYSTLLIVPSMESIDYFNEATFDTEFANLMVNDSGRFRELFIKVVYPMFQGKSVFIIVSRNDMYDRLTEALVKFIQTRYGFKGYIINEIADIDAIDQDDPLFAQHTYNLAADIEKASLLEMKYSGYVPLDEKGEYKNEDLLLARGMSAGLSYRG